MPLRAAGACALVAFTSAIGWIAGDLAQPAGAAVQAGTMAWFPWLAYLGVLLLAEEEQQAVVSPET